MVLEVNESSILEAFEHGVGSLLLCIGVAREERREVDELIQSDKKIECETSRTHWDFQVILRDCRVDSDVYHYGCFESRVGCGLLRGVCGYDRSIDI